VPVNGNMDHDNIDHDKAEVNNNANMDAKTGKNPNDEILMEE
jgi:hypothetical protein